MVLDMQGGLFGKNTSGEFFNRQLFTFGAENSDVVVVNETVAITGYIQLTAYGLGENVTNIGFEVTKSIKNESGAPRVVDWTVTNQTQSTTLHSGSTTLSDGELSTLTLFYDLSQIANGDSIRYTISNAGIGTALGSAVFAQMSFKVKSIFLKQDGK